MQTSGHLHVNMHGVHNGHCSNSEREERLTLKNVAVVFSASNEIEKDDFDETFKHHRRMPTGSKGGAAKVLLFSSYGIKIFLVFR